MSTSRRSPNAVALDVAVAELERQAPLSLAEAWDNVGLLVAPSRPRAVRTIGLCIDLTTAVLAEFEQREVDLAVAYHPPIFDGLKRVSARDVGSRVIARALELALPIYSPHTALDAAPNGVNDWLADGLGRGLRRALSEPRARIALPSEFESWPLVGQGRGLVLEEPVSLDALVVRIKKHLGLPRVRVARHPNHGSDVKLSSIALCAGAGGSVIANSGAEVLITGEMSHHHVLAALARGASVILSEHSHTERGFLPMFQERLRQRLGVDVVLATTDRDPLLTV